MTATKQKWTDEQYNLAGQIIRDYRGVNAKQTDWERAFREHPEWVTQFGGDIQSKRFKAFTHRAVNQSRGLTLNGRSKAPSTIPTIGRAEPVEAPRTAARSALPRAGSAVHGQAPYPEYVRAAAKLPEPFNREALSAVLPSGTDKKRVANAISAWAAINWVERVDHGTYKRSATFGTAVQGMEPIRRARLKYNTKRKKKLAAAETNGAAQAQPALPAPEPVPQMPHCPGCGLNLRMFHTAFAVALKHSQRH